MGIHWTMKTNRSRAATYVALLALSSLAQAGESAVSTQPIAFKITAPLMPQALIQFTQQSGLQLAFPVDGATKLPARKVIGDLTVTAALEKLLEGSGLRYEFTNERTVSIWSEKSLAGPTSSTHPAEAGQSGLLRLATSASADAGQNDTDTRATRNPVAEKPAIEEVIVTGEKIARSLKDTTTATTVLQEPDPSQFRSAYDIVSRVPNMVGNASGIPSIRGATGSGAGGGVFTLMSGARPRVATIIDDIAQSYVGQRYLDAGLWDVQQVEVLRGPQSTTQGRDSIGGAMIITTKAPTQYWESAMRLGYESEGDKGYVAGMLSGPIVADELAFRLTADGTQGHSYINYTGNAWPFDPAEIKQSQFRGKLLWTPQSMPDLRVTLSGGHREQQGEYLYTVTGTDFGKYTFDNPDLNSRFSDTENSSVAAKAEYDLTDRLTLHTVYAHDWYKATFSQANQTGGGRGFMSIDENSDTAEARLVFAPGADGWSGVAGLYYFKRDQFYDGDLGIKGPDSMRNYAAYADARYEISQGLSLLFGARVQNEHQQRDIPLWTGRVFTDDESTLFLPKLGLLYAATASTNIGLTVRKGYSPGGGALDWIDDSFYQYDKEEVLTYEFSTRTVAFDGRLSVNTNWFYNDYKDYQALVGYPKLYPQFVSPTDDGIRNNLAFVNLPKSRSYGTEIEVSYHPLKDLEIYGGLGLLSTKVLEAPAISPASENQRFSNAPALTAMLGLEYKMLSGFFFGASANHVSDYHSQIQSGTSMQAGDYTLVNAHAGYEAGRFSIRAYVKNLTDELTIYSGLINWAGPQGEVGQPRAFGLTVDTRF